MIIDYICDIFEEIILPNKINIKDIKDYSLRVIELFYKSKISNLSKEDTENIHYYLTNIAYDEHLIPLIMSFFKKKISKESYYSFIMWLASFSLEDDVSEEIKVNIIFLLINNPKINITELEEDLQKFLEESYEPEIQISFNKMYSSHNDFLNPFTLYRFKEDMWDNNNFTLYDNRTNHEPYIIVMNIYHNAQNNINLLDVIDELFDKDQCVQYLHNMKDVSKSIMQARILNLLKNYEYSDFSHLTILKSDEDYIYLVIHIDQIKSLQLAFNKGIYQALIKEEPNYITDITYRVKESLLKVNPIP